MSDKAWAAKSRDLLAEARRYVVKNPQEAQRLIYDASCEFPLPGTAGSTRLRQNLMAAYKFMRADPDAARGYIDGVRLELQVFIGRTA